MGMIEEKRLALPDVHYRPAAKNRPRWPDAARPNAARPPRSHPVLEQLAGLYPRLLGDLARTLERARRFSP